MCHWGFLIHITSESGHYCTSWGQFLRYSYHGSAVCTVSSLQGTITDCCPSVAMQFFSLSTESPSLSIKGRKPSQDHSWPDINLVVDRSQQWQWHDRVCPPSENIQTTVVLWSETGHLRSRWEQGFPAFFCQLDPLYIKYLPQVPLEMLSRLMLSESLALLYWLTASVAVFICTTLPHRTLPTLELFVFLTNLHLDVIPLVISTIYRGCGHFCQVMF